MKILIIGAGAIGGFIGGQLAAQHNVTLFDRAPLVEAVRARGLRIITPESEHTVNNLTAFTSLEEIFAPTPRFHLAIVSMKAFDTPAADGTAPDRTAPGGATSDRTAAPGPRGGGRG